MRVALALMGLVAAPALVLAHPFTDSRDPGFDHHCAPYPSNEGTFGLGTAAISTSQVGLVVNGQDYHAKLYVVRDGGTAQIAPQLFIESNHLDSLQEGLVCKDKADPRAAGASCTAGKPDPHFCKDHSDQQII